MNLTRRHPFLATALVICALVILLPAMLVTTACGNDLVTTLDLITTGVDLALPFITPLPPAVDALIENYFASVTTAVAQSATEMASTDTQLVKSEKVEAYFAAAVIPNLNAFGLPAATVAKIQGIQTAIQTFLTDIGATKTGAIAQARAAGVDPAKVLKTKTPVISKSAAAKLVAHANDVAAKLKKH